MNLSATILCILGYTVDLSLGSVQMSNHGRFQQKTLKTYVINSIYQKSENISSLEVCAMMCSQLMDTKTGCSAFLYSGNNCSMLLVEDDNIAGLTPETPDDKKVYFNIDSKTTLSYFKFFQIGSATSLAPIGFSVDLANGAYCKGTTYFDHLKDVAFPTGTTLASRNGIGYSQETSTLLLCGGIYITSSTAMSNQCYFYDLYTQNTSKSWNGGLTMNISRQGPFLIALKEKVYIVGGSNSAQYPNDGIEVFNSNNKTLEKVFDDQNTWVTVPVAYMTELTRCTCVIPMINENSFVILGGYSQITNSYFKKVVMFKVNTRTWEMLPDMLNDRGSHGCSRITMKGADYFVVMGGNINSNTVTNTILFYNLATQVWEFSSAQMSFPTIIGGFLGVKILHMNEDSCDAMFVVNYPIIELVICNGNYSWTSFDLAGKININKPMVVIGAAELTPC